MKIKKRYFTIEIVWVGPNFGRKFSFIINIWEQTQEQKRQTVSY